MTLTRRKEEPTMKKINVTVLNAQQIRFPDGHVETRSAHPAVPPPDATRAWCPALGRYMPADALDYPFDAEVDDV